ncbi:MAG TPA: anti-sigma factor, partial [Chloroflexia bacterium]|nr:anti-sigma factor [Chloroflexia bacterium]
AERDALARILASSQAKATVLTGSPATAHVQIWLDPATGQAVLATRDLPTAPDGKLYELWLIKGQTPIAVDVFRPIQGQGLLLFQLPGPPGAYTLAAITVESSKVDQPTSPPILAGKL